MPAHAQLKARVVSRADATQGVPSKVLMSHNGVEKAVGQTFADGSGTLSVAVCEAAMRFRPVPAHPWAWSGNQNDWKPCSGDRVELTLAPSDGFASLMSAYALDPDAFGPGSQLAAFQTSLQQAESPASVAMIANEMAYTLAKSGEQTLAAKYSSLAVAAGNESLKTLGIAAPDQALIYDPRQNAFVATPETLDVLSLFKKQQGLGGKETVWDGATFRKIEALTAAQEAGAPR